MTYNVFSGTLNPTQCAKSVGATSSDGFLVIRRNSTVKQ